MSVVHLTSESLPRALALPGKKVLLDFRADWCGPCQMLTPVLEKLSEDHPDVLVASIDVGEMPEAAAQFRVNSIPALFLLQDGKVLRQAVGYMDQKSLETELGL